MSRGSVYRYDTQRGVRWGFVVDLPGPDRQQRRRVGFRTRKECEQALTALQHRLAGYYTGRTITVGQWADQWVANMQKAPATVRGYAKNLRLYVLPRFGHRLLDDVSPLDVDAFYADLRATVSERTGRPLSPRTIEYTHATMSKLWADAIRKGLVSHNPTRGAERPRVPKKTGTTFWTATQLAEFLMSVGDRRDYTLWHVAAHTGMRRAELAALTWGDWDGERFTVVKAGDDGTGETKTRRGRTVTLDATSMLVMRRWRVRVLEDSLEWGWKVNDTTPIFTREDGRRYSLDYWSSFPKLIPEGLPRITLHNLRDTHASMLLAAGVHPKKVQERLGHSGIQVTMDVYSHVTPEMDADVADVFARALNLSQSVTGADS